MSTPASVEGAVARGHDRTADVGMILFLGSWAMMFAALFFGYGMLRVSAARWPPNGESLPLLLPALTTVLLVGSSGTLVLGLKSLRAGEPGKFLRRVIDTMTLGGLFIALQCVMWSSLWDSGLVPSSKGQLAGFLYLLTVVHAAHVAVGMALIVALLPRAWRREFTPDNHGAVRRTAMFWHFVSVVWLAIFASVFVF
jgi:cytochrome c oxidase subunit 3